MTRIPPPESDDEGAIAAWITAMHNAWANGELLEEIPWTAEDEVISNEVWDELDAELKQEAAARVAKHAERAAIAQRRRARRRRRAWAR